MSSRIAFSVATAVAWIPLALVLPAAATAQSHLQINLGREDSVDIGLLLNAPNGHISYEQQGTSAPVLWVDGRIRHPKRGANPPDTTQGTFMVRPASWKIADLDSATPLKVLEAVHDNSPCTASSAWDRNYAAINAIIPAANGGLLAFIDGEFHPHNTGTPLRASIGVAMSTDQGKSWPQRAVIIQGKNMVLSGFNCVAVDNMMRTPNDNVGAAGPSAVLHTVGNISYIYLYYLDRVLTPANGGAASGIYVARAPYSGNGAPGTWQFWTGQGWSKPAGPEVAAAPVITPPPRDGEAAQPQVTYNTALKRWLIVYHTRSDLYAATSADGITWDTPQALGASIGNARSPAFPTLVTEGSPDQQTTGAKGWLFYSREVDSPPGGGKKAYLGFRRTFAINTAVTKKPPCASPRECCSANGGTWSGGRCH
jgi:hypothetical protein